MFYSKSTGGFYSTKIHGANMPPDAVEISDEQHAELLAGQSSGKLIAADTEGAPYLADRPPPSLDQLRARALSLMPSWEQSERTAGIEHRGHAWLTTPEALQDIRDALLAGIVPGGVWIDAARTQVTMTLADLQALWAAMVTSGAAIYQRRLQMEAAIATMNADQLSAFMATIAADIGRKRT